MFEADERILDLPAWKNKIDQRYDSHVWTEKMPQNGLTRLSVKWACYLRFPSFNTAQVSLDLVLKPV